MIFSAESYLILIFKLFLPIKTQILTKQLRNYVVYLEALSEDSDAVQ